MKAAVIVFSDPASGTDEALGRLYNALATTYELKRSGDDVTLLFQGPGTRWPAELAGAEHPAHALFEEVRDVVAGASCGCAEAFGATESVEAAGFELIRESELPGTSGVSSLRRLVAEGRTVLTF